MHPRRILVATFTLGLAAVGLGAVGVPAAEASCAGPQLSVQQKGTPALEARKTEEDTVIYAITSDEPVTFLASNLADGCHDTDATTRTGCGPGTPTPLDPVRPLSNLDLVLRQDGHRWTLAQADGPRLDLTLKLEVELPAAARPGPAVLELTSKEEVNSSIQLQLS